MLSEANKYYNKYQCRPAFSDFCRRFRNLLNLIQGDNCYKFYYYYKKLDNDITSEVRKWIFIFK